MVVVVVVALEAIWVEEDMWVEVTLEVVSVGVILEVVLFMSVVVLMLEGIWRPLFMAQRSRSLLCVLPHVIFTMGIMVRGTIPIARLVVFVIRGVVVVATTMHHITTAGVVGVTGVGAAMAGGADATTPTDGDAILTTDGAIGHMMLLLALSSWRRQ